MIAYTLENSDFPQSRTGSLLDSLRGAFGPPTHRIDSMLYTSETLLPIVDGMTRPETIQRAVDRGFIGEGESPIIDSTVTMESYSWRADRTALQLITGVFGDESNGYSIYLYERPAAEQMHQIRLRVDSTLQANTVAPITSIGDLNLLVTNTSNQFTGKERDRLYGEGTYTSYTFSCSLAEPFFGIEQTSAYRNVDFDAIQSVLRFASWRSDSLSYVRFQFQREVPDPGSSYRSMTLASYEKVAGALEERFGSPALEVQYTDPGAGRQYPIGFWPGTPFSGVVTSREADVRAEFYRTDPEHLNIDLLTGHVPRVPPSMILPLTKND